MPDSVAATPPERALAMLRRKGNPFRQQFARNCDDPVCSHYHVDSLFANERHLLSDLVESFRGQPDQPSAVLPLLGPRGAGKTHLLHCLKHGPGVAPRLFVTPGTFRVDTASKDSSFVEYVLYQLINVVLGGAEQRGDRPLRYVGHRVTRLAWAHWLEAEDTNADELMSHEVGADLFGRLGQGTESLSETLAAVKLDPKTVLTAWSDWLVRHEPRDLKGAFRRRLLVGFATAAALGDESDLADFLTDGFADVAFLVKPTRAQLTLSLLQALVEVVVRSGIPIAVAFDQLEELLYGQTEDEIRRASDGFFGGIVQVMSQVPGLVLLLFVEEGLWNRIVPPLPSHILDRLHEPLHLPHHGTVRHTRLSTPTAVELVEVVACRVRRTLAAAGFDAVESLDPVFPFGMDFLRNLARRESVLRLMLQGCCNRLDEMFEKPEMLASGMIPVSAAGSPLERAQAASSPVPNPKPRAVTLSSSLADLFERWHQEVRAAERKLKPVGSLTGATSELQGGLARWLQLCRQLGVEQGDWRMTRVEDLVQIGDHPTYGALTIIEWQGTTATGVQRVGIGLWLGRGVGKPRDLETKLAIFQQPSAPVDHLILLRPADDARLSGRTQAAWDSVTKPGRVLRLEPVDVDVFAKLYAFPRWIQQVHESYQETAVPDDLYVFLAEQTESIMIKLGLPESESRLAA